MSNEMTVLDDLSIKDKIFDAYVFVSGLVKSAEHSIVLIDNYVDETVLTLLSKRKKKCSAIIYTKNISKKLELERGKTV